MLGVSCKSKHGVKGRKLQNYGRYSNSDCCIIVSPRFCIDYYALNLLSLLGADEVSRG